MNSAPAARWSGSESSSCMNCRFGSVPVRFRGVGEPTRLSPPGPTAPRRRSASKRARRSPCRARSSRSQRPGQVVQGDQPGRASARRRRTGGAGRPGCAGRTPGRGTSRSSGLVLGGVAGGLDVQPCRRSVRAVPWRPRRVGSTQSNMVDAEGDRLDERRRVADAHQVAGPVGGQLGDRGGQRRAASRRGSRPPTARRCRSRRSRARRCARRSRRRRAASMPPWTMPNSAWSSRRWAARARAGPRRGALDGAARRPSGGPAAAGTRRAPSGCRRRAAPGCATAASGVRRCVEPS